MAKLLQAVRNFKLSRVLFIKAGMLLVLIGILAFSLYKIAEKVYDYKQNERLYAELQRQFGPDSVVPQAVNIETTEPKKKKKFAKSGISEEQKVRIAQMEKEMAEIDERRRLETNLFKRSPELLQINRDIVGWIKVPNTNIDYPIVQSNDNDYYLTRDVTKKRNSGGSIFMDYRNDRQKADKNTILYGHNMKDKSMFHDVVEYKKKPFFDENDIIYTYTPEGVKKWEVFLVFVSDVSFDYIVTDFATDKEFQQYINGIWRKAYHTKDIKLSPKDQILTLSTCSYEFDDARTVVSARLVKEIDG